MRQIGSQLAFGFEVDVERDDVEKRQLQILGGRIIDVSDDCVGIFFLYDSVEPMQVTRDATAAEPARLRCHDLVAQGKTKQCRMAGTQADLGSKASYEI